MAKKLDPDRAELAEAIAAHRAAENDVEQARGAALRAADKAFEARRNVDALKQALDAPPQADSVLTDDGVAALAKAHADLLRRFEEAQHEAQIWRQSEEVSRGLIEGRERDRNYAARRLDDAARVVFTKCVNLPGVLDELNQLQSLLVEKRLLASAIREFCDDDGKRALDKFFAVPFLKREQLDNEWKRYPDAEPFKAAFDALHRDPQALAPIFESGGETHRDNELCGDLKSE